jgi:predicted PurR-regulated permease PerM
MTLTPAQTHGLAWLAIGLVTGLALWLLGPVLTPFVVALVLGYALHPVVDKLARRGWPRWLAVGLVELLAAVTLLAVLLLVVPILVKNLPALRDQIPLLLTRMDAWLGPKLAPLGIAVPLDVASVREFVLTHLSDNTEGWWQTALSSLRIGGSFVLGLVGTAVLLPVVLFYVLMDWPQIVARFQALVPPHLRAAFDGFMADCDHMLGQYLHGQLMVMGILAVYYSAGLALFGLDLAVPVGVFTGLAIFIPYIGFGLGCVLALLAGLLEFGSLYGVVAVAVVYGIGQVVESFFLTPRLVGERIGLHPITVIFALLAFGQLFGFIGVLVALPVSAVGVVAFGRLKAAYLGGPLYRGTASAPEPDA